ncbi:hypothetical protein [Pseudoruegeria sp. HB172150]|uniref:hypothetical protein n=1 Tax=Pseudoruegeria sp. HB172150 TaxID=2721164 RepID=UPI001553EDB2|nr:hypothetical protein [Pseudoruegeria sp. HB172150]
MHIKLWAALAAAAISLSACGETPLEQGALGAGAGTGAALLTGGDLATGAVLGAAGNLAYCQYVDRAKCQ